MENVADKINDAIDLIIRASTDDGRKEAAAAAKRLVETEIELEGVDIGDGADDERIVDAVHRLLDEVERPVGTQTFNVPKSTAVDRALIGLHDAIGRGL